MYNPEQAYQYADLILRYLNGKLNKNELAELTDWLNSDIRNRQFVEFLQTEDGTKKQLEFFSSVNSAEAWKSIKTRHSRQSAPLWRPAIWKYSAAVLLLLTTAFLLNYSAGKRGKTAVTPIAKRYNFKSDVAPGGEKARLTLADGSVIILEDAGNGVISAHAGVKISKQNGQLVYQVLNSNAGSEFSYNTISTPRGGQYQVLLPDGSKVWLNASSSLNFPTSFTGAERIVKLSGEAYFEIAKVNGRAGAMPFKVLANNTAVQVLGTHFNVMAYPDEMETRTTLLEGSVKISKGEYSRMILPGQEAKIRSNGSGIDVRDADIDEAMAWKNGLFLFNNEDIEMVMRQVSRWYDVEVSYKEDIPKGHYTGKVSRNTNVSKILDLLELTGGARFEIENKKIKIYR